MHSDSLDWSSLGDAILHLFPRNFDKFKTGVWNQGRTVFAILLGIGKIGQLASSMELMQRVDPKSRTSDEVPQNKTIH